MNELNAKKPPRTMSPVEVMVYNLCSDDQTREDVFHEIETKLKLFPKKEHIEINLCLVVLKKRGLILC